MRAVFPSVDVLFRIGAPGPPGAQQQPRARGNAAMLRFPLLDSIYGEQEIRVFRDICCYIDHACRSNELPGWNFVHAAVRQVLAADPVDWRVKMRAGVLAGLKAVPETRRAAFVIS